MLRRIEFFRTMHYFYFYLSCLGIFISVQAVWAFPLKSAFIIGAAIVNMCFSYYADFKVRELLVMRRGRWLMSHAIIVSLAIAHYLMLMGRYPFFAIVESTLIITAYLSILRTLIIIMVKLKLFETVLRITGFSGEHIGMKKAIFLLKERAYLFENLIKTADPDVIMQYRIGTSQTADGALRKIDESGDMDCIKDNMKLLFICIYDGKLKNAANPSEKRKIKKIVRTLTKTADI